ncbi:MAG: cysteine desulfurase NifS [Clostridia bacterium]|nr:cysteine desulfurase NifS [Clostridia bacterium]
MSCNHIYFDHGATTFVRPEVIAKMLPYFGLSYGNPSSIYNLARSAKHAVDSARATIAECINANADEIYFTGCGSESDNWALKGVLSANKKKGNHIITSAIEHHAIISTCEYLEKQGYEVTYVPVDEFGMVNPADIEAAITDKTVLISVMFANNEIGTIEPVKEIGEIAKKHNIYFHTDAVQAVGHIPVDVEDMNIDLLSMSAHKFNGPKGIGALYIKKGVKIDNFIHGGGQEKSKRAGTENVPSIVGMAEALRLACLEMEEHNKKLIEYRDKIIAEIQQTIPYVKLNGHPTKRLPGNVNFSFNYIEGESLLLSLDLKGISASTGSACASGSLDPSHVLLGIGLSHEVAHGSLRITLGYENENHEVNYLLQVLPEIVEKLRAMSPLYENVLKENK